jgi:hypothetical protein
VPVTAVNLMNGDVIPTFGTYAGRSISCYPTTTSSAASLTSILLPAGGDSPHLPVPNGIVERLQRTLLDQHFRVEGLGD